MIKTELEELMDRLPEKIRDMIIDKYKGKEKDAALAANVTNDMIDAIVETLAEISQENNERIRRMEKDIQWIKEQLTSIGEKKKIVDQLDEIRTILKQMRDKD